MFQLKYPVEQTEPPRSPRDTLPTMYNLPSENPEEPGLPDEFHALQPQLLSRTCRPPQISAQQMFTGADMNLYYDVRHPRALPQGLSLKLTVPSSCPSLKRKAPLNSKRA